MTSLLVPLSPKCS